MDFLLAEINRKSKQIEQNEVTSVSILSLWQTVILIVKGVVVQSVESVVVQSVQSVVVQIDLWLWLEVHEHLHLSLQCKRN